MAPSTQSPYRRVYLYSSRVVRRSYVISPLTERDDSAHQIRQLNPSRIVPTLALDRHLLADVSSSQLVHRIHLHHGVTAMHVSVSRDQSSLFVSALCFVSTFGGKSVVHTIERRTFADAIDAVNDASHTSREHNGLSIFYIDATCANLAR